MNLGKGYGKGYGKGDGQYGGKGGEYGDRSKGSHGGNGYGKGYGKGDGNYGGKSGGYADQSKGSYGGKGGGGFGSMHGGRNFGSSSYGGSSGGSYGSSSGGYENGSTGGKGNSSGGFASGLDRYEIRRRMEAEDRSRYQGFMRVMTTSDRKQLLEMICNAGNCKDILTRAISVKDIDRVLEIMGPCARQAWDGFDFEKWTHMKQLMDFCFWIYGEMKDDKWDEFLVFIRKNLYRWGGPRLIREAGGLINFIIGGGLKKVLMAEMSGDYGNVMFCGGSTILEAELRKTLESEVLKKDGGEGSTLGDAFSDISASLITSIKGQSESGSGGGDGEVNNAFHCTGGGGEIMETPKDDIKLSRENLQARMEELQADFKRLEDDERNDSPAASVKKRKRRASKGKGRGET